LFDIVFDASYNFVVMKKSIMFQENMLSGGKIYGYEIGGENTDFEKYIAEQNGETVAFSGHRPSYLPWGSNEECSLCAEFKSALVKLVEKLIMCGYKRFIIGAALGFDIIAGEIILKLKEVFKDIELVIAIPCRDQDEFWKDEDKKRRYKLILEADSAIYVSDKYNSWCYQKRNKFMVDESDLLVAYLIKANSGTEATVDYASKKGKPIIFLK